MPVFTLARSDSWQWGERFVGTGHATNDRSDRSVGGALGMMGHADAGVRGPSDKEVVAHLQRLASARAHLLHAEQAAADAAAAHRRDQVRNAEIEEAHATVLWARAQLLASTRHGRAERAVQQAAEAERRVLRRHGYGSFASYLDHRTSTPTADIALDLAYREHAAALAEWEALTGESAQAPATAPAVFEVPGANGHPVEPRAEARVVRDDTGATVVIDLTGDNPRRIA